MTALAGEGGPLRRFETRYHLTSVRLQIVVAIGVAWLPIVILGLVTEHVTGRRVDLLHDAAMHVRLLVATPLLLFLDRVFPIACNHVVGQLSQSQLIREAEQPRFERLLARFRSLSDWWLPELALLIAAFALGTATLITATPVGPAPGITGSTVAGWWYAVIGLPMFDFLIFRSLWRWLIWVRFVVGLSRLDLDLCATHPDRRGGISFLRRPSLAYCAMLLFASSAVLSAAWAERFQLVSPASFVPLLLAFAVVAIVVAFAPLLLFALPLHRTKVATLDSLGRLATRDGRRFRERWLAADNGEAAASGEVADNGKETDSGEVQGLVAIAETYRDTVQQIRLVLFDRKDLVLVLLATLLPVVPGMVVQIPHDEWLAMASFLFGQTMPL